MSVCVHKKRESVRARVSASDVSAVRINPKAS